MDLYPAIDLRDGRCVRLTQGDYARQTTYDADPIDTARRFADAGAAWIHVVDLDAARTGLATNRDVVTAIAAAVDVPVQSGGGVRTLDAARALLDGGVARVVIGTAAVEEPELVNALVESFPGRVAIGLDHRLVGERREVAVRGWTEGSGRELLDAVASLGKVGVSALVVTDIGRDGMLAGTDVEGLAAVLGATEVDVVASGGVASVADIEALCNLGPPNGRRLAGVIVGKALYEGNLTIEEAVAACAR